MSIQWGRVVLAAFLMELVLFAIAIPLFLSGAERALFWVVPPAALIATFATTVWVGRRITSKLVLHGAYALGERPDWAWACETAARDALGRIEGQPRLMGDFVIARKDTPTSYHLSVTGDDQLQGVTLVTRGVDVVPSTHVHVLLQKLLGYAVPQYAHHRLLTDAAGRRFAKRDRDMTIRAMRESGMRPDDVVRLALHRAHDHDLPDREPPARS